jgi:predicted RNA-binding Zn-ribbon protein involved in translation (DUF1610 family)
MIYTKYCPTCDQKIYTDVSINNLIHAPKYSCPHCGQESVLSFKVSSFLTYYSILILLALIIYILEKMKYLNNGLYIALGVCLFLGIPSYQYFSTLKKYEYKTD